jgi:hypothetical protein
MERLVCGRCPLPVILQAHGVDSVSEPVRKAVIGCKIIRSADDKDLDAKLKEIVKSNNLFEWDVALNFTINSLYKDNTKLDYMDRVYFQKSRLERAQHVRFWRSLGQRDGVYMFKEVDAFKTMVKHAFMYEEKGRNPRQITVERSVYDMILIKQFEGDVFLHMKPNEQGGVFFVVYRNGEIERVIDDSTV